MARQTAPCFLSVARSAQGSTAERPPSRTQFDHQCDAMLNAKSFHGGLVPRDTCAWPVRNVNRAAADLTWFRQKRITPVSPFQPVGGFRDTHKMGGKFRIEMSRHGQASGAGDCGRS